MTDELPPTNYPEKGSTLREEKQAEERARLENYIAERRKDIVQAELSKSRLADETDQMIVGERQRREDEKRGCRK